MRRKISSSATNFYKVLFSLPISAIILINLFFGLVNLHFLQLFLSLLFGIIGFYILRWIFDWKKIEITETGVFISRTNFWDTSEIFVSFDQIQFASGQFASEGFWAGGNPEFVSIKFSILTEFGDKVWFIPKTRFFAFSAHPIIEEINQKIKSTYLN